MNTHMWRRKSSLYPVDEVPYLNPFMVPDDRLAYWARCHNYQLGEKIGEGSFGKVFKAFHTKSNTIVAFKFIFKLDELKSLQQEVEILQKLHHPNIVRMLESFGNENGVVLVMEFVPRSLKEIIETEGILSEERTQTIICHLVSALHYLHRKSILHRDLKPPNVLVDVNDVAKLCDFGLARFMLTGTQVLTQASLKGTPLYMAPEVINSPVIPPTYNHNADLWSLGCIAYHLICGKPPFDTRCLMHLVLMMKDQPIVWPNTVSSVCQDFLEQLLQKNPSERLTWPGLLEHEFVKNKVFIINELSNSDVSSEIDNVVFPLNSMKIIEEEEASNSSSEHNLTSIGDTTEEDLRSSQSSWCSETCLELDVCSNGTNSTSDHSSLENLMGEEWSLFLKESGINILLGDYTSMHQKSFILSLLASLDNSQVSANLIQYIITLLMVPFSNFDIPESEKDSIVEVFLEAKVIPCLMQSFSNVFKSSTHSCASPVPPDTIGKQELYCLDSVLLLIKGLSLNKPLDALQQFIESVILLKIVPLLQKCLSLSHGYMDLVANTLAVLLLTLIYLPHNINIVLDILIGKYLEGRIPNVELHKLLRNNENPTVRERTCMLLLHITRLSPNSFANIWHQTLTNDIEFLRNDPSSNVVQAATYASEILNKTLFYVVENEE